MFTQPSYRNIILGNVPVTVFIVIIPAATAAIVVAVIVVAGGASGFDFVFFSPVLEVIPFVSYSSRNPAQYWDYC
jgi:hypothetical protein